MLYQLVDDAWVGIVCWSPGGGGEMNSDRSGEGHCVSSSECLSSVMSAVNSLAGGGVGGVVSNSDVSRDGVRAVHELPLDILGE